MNENESNRYVEFFFVPDMEPENKQARDLLRAKVPDIEIAEVACQPSLKRYYNCPFIRSGVDKEVFYGLDGIESFIRLRGHMYSTNQQHASVA